MKFRIYILIFDVSTKSFTRKDIFRDLYKKGQNKIEVILKSPDLSFLHYPQKMSFLRETFLW